VFPEHEHLGREEVLVVQGSLRDSDEQQVLGPGEETRKQAGTSHRIEVLPGPALVYLVIIREGVRIGPRVLRPGDPDI
jgi:anti-sigma factor ChrR (cupin superfamily)